METHEAWLLKANNDLRSAIKLSKDPEVILDTSIYHTQQAAEKALKAFLIFKKQTLRRVHDLEYLLGLCCILDQRFREQETTMYTGKHKQWQYKNSKNNTQ